MEFKKRRGEWEVSCLEPKLHFIYLKKKEKEKENKHRNFSFPDSLSFFFSPNRNDSRENTFLLVMGWESNIQTFHKLFSVFFSCYSCLFFNRVEKILNTRVLLSYTFQGTAVHLLFFYLCALLAEFAHWLPSVQSGLEREGGGRKTRLLLQLQGISLSTVELKLILNSP